MYLKTIKGVDYHLFDNEKEFRKEYPKEKINTDWRTAEEGEWTITDDGQILSIIKKSTINSTAYKGKQTVVKTLLGLKYLSIISNGPFAFFCGAPVSINLFFWIFFTELFFIIK